MRQIKAYMGTINDPDLRDVLSSLIEEIKNEGEFMYLEWNGVFIYIDKNSTVDRCIKQYNSLLEQEEIYQKYKGGKLISIEELGSRIARFITDMGRLNIRL